MSPLAQNLSEAISHNSPEAVPAWKQELNERLAATRSRRLRRPPEQVALPGLESIQQKAESRASRLAARVAQRYANAPSYSDAIAAEVRARADAAARERKAANLAPTAAQPAPAPSAAAIRKVSPEREELSVTAAPIAGSSEHVFHAHPELEESHQEGNEIDATVEPLAVNLIEFPRELVAARKMRPRLAEGPLRESNEEPAQNAAQARASALPATSSRGVSIGPAPANWSPIRLDEDSLQSQPAHAALAEPAIALNTATLEDRIMAGVFDTALVVAAFAVFVAVFVACSAHPPAGKPALVAAALVLAGFALLYQYLFFRYAEGTPGMRYAKIALCTFEDENPTRQAMCRRVLFLVLSAAPLGLGFIWACFDQDRLSWHDRISRMYQRSYS